MLDSNVASNTLRGRLAHKQEALKKVCELKAEIGSLAERIKSQRNQLPELTAALDSLSRTVETDEKAGSTSPYRSRLHAVEHEHGKLIQSLSEYEKRQKELSDQLYLLNDQVAVLDAGATLEEALAHKEDLVSAREEVCRIENLLMVAEQEYEHATSGCEDELLDRLQEQRENLLADIAIGEGDSAALREVDTEIKKAVDDDDSQQAKALSELRDKGQTLSGLRRRLETAQKRFEDIKAETPLVLEQLLLGRAEEVSNEYLKLADGMRKAFEQMKSIDELMGELVPTRKNTLMLGGWYRMFLPSFRLRSFEGIDAHDAAGGVLFSADHALRMGWLDGLAERERERLVQAGCKPLLDIAKHKQ